MKNTFCDYLDPCWTEPTVQDANISKNHARTEMHKLLHTEVVVLQRQRGVTSLTHDGRHCDLPDSEVTVLLLVLLFLLDVQRCFSAGR